jgi:hypothetical protein
LRELANRSASGSMNPRTALSEETIASSQREELSDERSDGPESDRTRRAFDH